MRLLERSEHLGILTSALDRAQRSGEVVLVSGEPGVGKTALVETFCVGLEGIRVLSGRCDDLFAPRPLGPFADIARQVGGPLRDAIGRADPQAAFDAFLDVLAGDRHPNVVVLEDLQWADDATLDLLRFAARRVAQTSTLLIGTHRDAVPTDHPLRRALGALTGPNVHRIELPPLSVSAVHSLAEGRQVDVVALHEATGGNPFFVVEVLAAEVWTMPTTVRDAVLARVAALDTGSRDALAAVAVLGAHASPGLVMRVAGCEGEAIEHCLAAGLLDVDGTALHFRHEMSRRAVEGSLTPWRQASLHSAALAALGDEAGAVTLAHHAISACDEDAVLRLAPRAAAECASLGAHRAAARLSAAALLYAGDLDEHQRLDLFEAHARACRATGDFEGAHSSGAVVLDLLRSLGADQRREGAWLSWMFGATCGQSPSEGTAHLEQSFALLEPLGDTIELATALGQAAGWAMVRSDREASLAFAQRGLPLAEQFGDEDLIVRFLDMMGSARLNCGDDGGIDLLHDAVARAERAGLQHAAARACNNLGAGFDATWRPLDAVPWLDRALAIASAHEIAITPPLVLADRAEAQVKLGRWDAAAESLRLALADPSCTEGDRGYVAAVMGTLRGRRGDPGAKGCLDQGLASALATDLLQYIHPVRIARAELALLGGAVDAAREEVTALIDLHRTRTEPWRLGELALWCHRTGTELPIDAPIAEPFALHVAGRHDEAAAMWEIRGCAYAAADALGDSGTEADLRQALEILHSLGAGPRAAQVAGRLRELGARMVPRGPRSATRAHPAGLTAREAEVAGLVADGLSNAQIGRRLVVSPKTVDHHVSAVLMKLRVSSRRDVGAALAGEPQDGEGGGQT